MSKVVNLRQARKQRARQTSRAKADENAARHGLSKDEKRAQHQEAEAQKRFLDGRKLSPDDT